MKNMKLLSKQVLKRAMKLVKTSNGTMHLAKLIKTQRGRT